MNYFCNGMMPQLEKLQMPINQPELADDTVPPGATMPGSPLIPEILPEAPRFQVPPNPVLPPGYQEVIDYNALQYMNGFLRTQIGQYATVDFLIGSSSLVQKAGTLVGVGLNYILLYDPTTDTLSVCDFYSIKFVNFRNPI